MSNEYNIEETKIEAAKAVERDGFRDARQSVFAVMLSAAVGLWVMFTMAAGADVGVNWFIFVLLSFFSVAVMMYLDDNLRIPHAVFWLIAIALIGSTFFRMYEFPVLAFLFMPTAVVFFTIFAAKKPEENVVAKFLYRHFLFFIHFWNLFLVRLGKAEDGRKWQGGKVLWGIGISVILLLIIVPLMFSADMMFETTMEKVFNFDLFDRFFGRLVVGIIITLLLFAFLFTVTVKKDMPFLRGNAAKRNEEMRATVITVLSVLSAVFLAFVIVQVRFLFFESSGALPQGYTYAEYAVDGYWSQAALTALNLAIVLTAMGLSKGTKGKATNAIHGLLTLMTTLNVYLVLAAAYKMHLYENAYGYTERRLLVYLILLFELIALGLLIYSVFKRDFPFIKTVVCLAAAYFAVAACFNLQAFSVNQNIKRYEKTGEIDISYMIYSAPDAAMQKKDFYIENYQELTSEQRENFERDFNLYDYQQRYRTRFGLEQYYKEDLRWFEFNLARYREYQAGGDILDFLQRQGK